MSESGVFFFRSGHSDAGDSAPAILAGRDRLGGKGASLHAMAALGYRVPPGFTLSAEWSMRCHERGGEWPDALRELLRRSVARLEEITGRDLGIQGSLRVAVRSGASESMPGMMDTVLGAGTQEEIERAVDQVLRSYWSERAVSYRRERGLARLGGTAVTVQEMCPAEFAGVAFTAHPESGEDRVVIEAVRGLGEGLVSGAVTPDRYVLERTGLEVAERVTAGPRALLGEDALRAVASCALELECGLSRSPDQCRPLDVEWALREGQVWLLQARAIRRAAAVDPDVRALLTREARALSSGEDAMFARYNLGETLSHPTPMSWDLHRRFFRGRDGFLGLYRDLGFQPSQRVIEEGFLTLVAGRVYANAGRAAEIFYGSDLLGWDRDAIRRDPSVIDGPPRDWNHGAPSFASVLRALKAVLRSARRGRRLRALYPRRFEKLALPAWTSWVETERTRDLSDLSAPEILGVLEKRVERTFGRFPREALLVSYLAGVAYSELEDFLERRLGHPAGGEAARTLAGSIDDDLSVEQNVDLARLARGELALNVFVERWGHRARGEMELSRSRWCEEPDVVEKLARALQRSSGEVEARFEARRLEVRDEENRVLEILARDCGTAATRELRERLDFARSLIPWRENWKHHWMRGVALVRHALVALDERLGLEGQVFWLELEELRRVARGGGTIDPSLGTAVRQRHDAARVASSLDLPAVLDAEDLRGIERGETESPETESPETMTSSRGQDLEGTPIAAGRCAGRAWVCDSPESECPFPPPFVLVCSSTDPGWAPILARASGLVVERGGALSHGAIVCRDFGVPAACVPDATRILRTGEAIRIDGDRGLVKRELENTEQREGARDGTEARTDDSIRSESRVPPEPWVAPVRPRLTARAALGLLAAVVISLAIVGVPALGHLFLPVARFACDWTLEAGATPFGAIAWAAALAAALATLAGMFVIDRRQLRAMRDRLAWYRKELGRFGKRGKERHAERVVADLVRRYRQARAERTLELMRPIGWTFLPFVLGYLWVSERFPAEPLRPGTEFEVRATFRPASGSSLRYARLDIDERSRVRLLDDPWKKLTPNREHPELGPYTVVWAAEARAEGPARLAVTARRERLAATVLVTERRRFASKGIAFGAGEIAALAVDHPPLYVELPDPVFRTANAISKWITGGSELDPRDMAGGPLVTFLVLAVFSALFFQRCLGIR